MSPRRVLTRESYIVAAEVSGTVETEDDLFIATNGAEDKQSGEEQEEEVPMVTVIPGAHPALLHCDGCMRFKNRVFTWRAGALRVCPVCKTKNGVYCVGTDTSRCLRCTRVEQYRRRGVQEQYGGVVRSVGS